MERDPTCLEIENDWYVVIFFDLDSKVRAERDNINYWIEIQNAFNVIPKGDIVSVTVSRAGIYMY